MMTDVLIRPIISEKLTNLGEKLNRFGFVVSRKSNKLEIKNAVESIYGVSVTSVNTMVVPGKKRSRNTKSGLSVGVKSAYKKAIITLAEGDTIDFYSNI